MDLSYVWEHFAWNLEILSLDCLKSHSHLHWRNFSHHYFCCPLKLNKLFAQWHNELCRDQSCVKEHFQSRRLHAAIQSYSVSFESESIFSTMWSPANSQPPASFPLSYDSYQPGGVKFLASFQGYVSIFLNCCSCSFIGQRTTLRGKHSLHSSAYMSSQMLMIG